MPPTVFFPSRADRTFMAEVVQSFPFPLALTYERLNAVMDAEQPVEAAWCLRDAVECAIKFSGSLAVADVLQTDPDRASALAEVLLNERGLAIGAWVTLLARALEPLQPLAREGHLADSGRCVPELFGAFYELQRPKLTKTKVLRDVDSDEQSFTAWRNRVFGHGVFQYDRAWYARQTLDWLPRLHGFYEALRPVLAGRRLVGRTPSGEEVDWQGCDFRPLLERHEHHPDGQPLPMLLVSEAGSGRPALSFGPLLSVQRCRHCQEPAAFFIDRQKTRTKTIFLEYFRGHHAEHRDWAEVNRLTGLLPAGFEWRRQVYDTGEVLEGIRIRFRDFDEEYLRPGYLLDAIWQQVLEGVKGYILLTGPAGVGKSYLVQGLTEKERGQGRRIPVLSYHILSGRRTEHQLFAIELNEQVRERLGCKTLDLQLKGKTADELQADFADFVGKVMRAKGLDALVIAVDGLDELPEEAPTVPLLTDLLPPAKDLPDGCFVLLSGRPHLRPRVRARLDRLREAGPEGYVELKLDPKATDNERLLEAYLAAHLPPAFRGPGPVAEVVRRSGGVFLYAAHYCRALETGVFTDTAALPPGETFYPVFLARLRDQVGAALYDAVYLPTLLFLTAAMQPVTREQLEGWGLAADRLQAALNDLRDFVRVRRVRGWHDGLTDDGEQRYELAHEAFLRFVSAEADLAARLRRCHEVIAARALMKSLDGWSKLDPADDADLYDLRFVLPHAEQAGRADWGKGLALDEEYGLACGLMGNTLYEKGRLHLATDLCICAERVFRGLLEDEGRAELADCLAAIVMTKGMAQARLGQLGEAGATCDQAIAILRRLVKDEGRAELANHLACALTNKGNAMQLLGQLGEALMAYDQAIPILRRLVEGEGRAELANDLAGALMNKGVALGNLGQLREAVAAYDQAIASRRRLVEDEGRAELANDLATALMNKGNALQRLGHLSEAVAAYDQAIAIRRRLVEGEGRAELANDLAAAQMNKGVALGSLGQLREAVAAHDQAIAIRRRLVEDEGRAELANDLAGALINKGMSLRGVGELREAVATDDQAIAILRRLVEGEGRADLANDLARAVMNKGVALRDLGQLGEAAAACDQAIAIRRRLVEDEGRADLANDLARALMNKGLVLPQLKEPTTALVSYKEAISIWEGLVQEGMAHLIPDLVKGYRIRFDLCRQFSQWPAAAADVLRALSVALPHMDDGSPPEPLSRELGNLVSALRDLSDADRTNLDDALGEHAEAVRAFIES